MFLRILGGGIVFILFAVLGTLSVVTLTKTSDVDKRLYVAEKTLKDHEKELKKLHEEILALDKKAKGGPAGAQGDEWAYDGEAGPEKWGARYATCGNGKSQSPVNITGPFEKSSVTLKAEYKPGVLRVINTGRAVMVNVPPGNVLKVGAESYELQQISFHRPSQEQVDGKPMVMGRKTFDSLPGLLPGRRRHGDSVQESRFAFDALFAKLRQEPGPIWLTISL
jgi:hypothetical protein